MARERHRLGIEKVLQHHSHDDGLVIIFGHGATHDFMADALDPVTHTVEHHSPYCVSHCSITKFVSVVVGGGSEKDKGKDHDYGGLREWKMEYFGKEIIDHESF